MRARLAAVALLLGSFLTAQTIDSPEVSKAREEAERIRRLVDAGALPRKALVDAETAVAEAADEEALRRTLYGPMELHQWSEEQTQEMLFAASRLVERQEERLRRARDLVQNGASPATSLSQYEEELERRRRTLERAEERASLFDGLVMMVQVEIALQRALEQEPEKAQGMAERYDGSGVFPSAQLGVIQLEFQRAFGHPLPIGAIGDTPLHRSLGYDHRGRVDVTLHPDTLEGEWLRNLLRERQIPYFAFRGAVAGKSTGAHIHIGTASPRLEASR